MLNVVEGFAGSKIFSIVAAEHGAKTFTMDNNSAFNCDLTKSILDTSPLDIPFRPLVMWFSPPCTGFSVASIGTHWTGGKGAYIPKTKVAEQAQKHVKAALSLIDYFKPKYWYIENPRGVLRKMPFMQNLPRRVTVTYCQYGDNRMKPTDIWTNDMEIQFRPMCKNGDPCHEAAPRGSKTGTQGLKGNYERSKLPRELCEEIIKSILRRE